MRSYAKSYGVLGTTHRALSSQNASRPSLQPEVWTQKQITGRLARVLGILGVPWIPIVSRPTHAAFGFRSHHLIRTSYFVRSRGGFLVWLQSSLGVTPRVATAPGRSHHVIAMAPTGKRANRTHKQHRSSSHPCYLVKVPHLFHCPHSTLPAVVSHPPITAGICVELGVLLIKSGRHRHIVTSFCPDKSPTARYLF